jgi:hypothetical protein
MDWKAIGTDGGSEILLQNTSGQTSIWEMGGAAGTTVVGGGHDQRQSRADLGGDWSGGSHSNLTVAPGVSSQRLSP